MNLQLHSGRNVTDFTFEISLNWILFISRYRRRSSSNLALMKDIFKFVYDDTQVTGKWFTKDNIMKRKFKQ